MPASISSQSREFYEAESRHSGPHSCPAPYPSAFLFGSPEILVFVNTLLLITPLFPGDDNRPAADAAAGVSSRLAEIIYFLVEDKRPPGDRVLAVAQHEARHDHVQFTFSRGANRDVSQISGVCFLDTVLQGIAMGMAGRVKVRSGVFGLVVAAAEFMDMEGMHACWGLREFVVNF